MRLFTQDSSNQFNYIGDYDITPSAPMNSGQNGYPIGDPKRSGRFRLLMGRYSKTTIGVLIGLIVGILFISIGFFKTLLLAILMAVGFVIGGFFDRNPIVMKFLRNLG